MSVWAHIVGTVKIRKDKHISLSTVIGDFIPDANTPSIKKVNEVEDTYTYSINISYPSDNQGTVDTFRDFYYSLSHRGCKMDLELTSRWIN